MISRRKQHHRSLTRQEADDYNHYGYRVMRARDHSLRSAIRWHCNEAQVPFLIVSTRRRYCSVLLDFDPVFPPRDLPARPPFAKWALEAIENIPAHLRSYEVLGLEGPMYVHKLRIADGIRLAERIADYLRKVGYVARPVDVEVIDLASERNRRRPDGPNGVA